MVSDIKEFASDYTERNIHLADIISALLDAGLSGKQIRMALKAFPPATSDKAVISHLLLKRKHSLFRKYFATGEVYFDVLYVKLALENDSFDSLFMIYNAYPLELTAHLNKLT